CCPSAPYEDEHLTTYFAVVGPDTMFPGSTPRVLALVDDPSDTICTIEVSPDRAVHWMSPYDIDCEELLAGWAELQSPHPQNHVAGYADGHAKSLNKDIDLEVLRDMLTVREKPPA